MSTQEVREAEPTDVVIKGFTERELTEMRRGLVQRMVVAKANLDDMRNPDDYYAWGSVYGACQQAYSKLNHASAVVAKERAAMQDEFGYLTRE